MGLYINPKGITKEEWLRQHAVQIDAFPEEYTAEHQQQIPLVWVRNEKPPFTQKPFTAVAVMYGKREFDYFKRILETEKRPVKFYLAPYDKVNEVTEGGLKKYMYYNMPEQNA